MGLKKKKICFQEQYLPFPTATDDPFTVAGGSDGSHSDPMGAVNDIHQPARLGGEGADFPVIPSWHERETKGSRISAGTPAADRRPPNHKRASESGEVVGWEGQPPLAPWTISPDAPNHSHLAEGKEGPI